MSFSAKIKEEILKADLRKKNLAFAFLKGFSSFALNLEEGKVHFYGDNDTLLKRISFICKKQFGIEDGNLRQSTRPGKSNCLSYEKAESEIILKGLSEKNSLSVGYIENDLSFLENSEEIRFFIMGGFLGGGMMIDPEKTYHLEFVAKREVSLDELTLAFDKFGEIPKRVMRDKYFVMYFKRYESIENLLNIMNAHKCMMDLANIKIEKEQKNEINRKTNFEVANLGKTTQAANKIIEDIENIMYTIGLDSLPDELSEIALLRLANPEESLAVLASLSGLSRSGVNHRLKKITEIARELE